VGKLIYSAIQSLDGYIADANGEFAWGEPDEGDGLPPLRRKALTRSSQQPCPERVSELGLAA
jgi:hypothetical protein